ncbi:sugar phosphate isomerase/epimerase family protein [Halomonas lysinitropha]|uniref:Xylose isomerase-like TIM barrel n=1 Tax=Halomonas lysinitropha TaxID=2607506 RepID=A0A5K1HYV3_9GAMM|nr:sugar phosphate isomerase/epimerase [Halomonas lysinitropha]VVZ94734.1 Xylose isomerase-like TIM barrel [Halomonas lysinitropha]
MVVPSRFQMAPFPSLLSGAADAPAALIATSAYGQDLIAELGQAAVLPWLAAAGADGVEIRRELLPVGFADFSGLGRACAEQGLAVIYSAPEGLWQAGRLAEDLDERLGEAAGLGALAIKVSLGHYPVGNRTDWVALRERLTAAPPLLVENDQTLEGGTQEPLAACLEDAAAAGCPLGMTFDIGNWHWTGSDPLAAARRLGPFVRYLHCKGVVRHGGRLKASVPDDEELSAWRELLDHLPAQLPRAIEYPLQGQDLAALTADELARLRRL